MAATTREKQDASVRLPHSRRERPGTRRRCHGGLHLLATVLLSCALLACGGRTNGDGGGGGGAGGTSGTAGAGAAGTGGVPADGGGGTAGDAGWTECATPDVEFCGTPECTCSTGDCLDPGIWRDAGGGSGGGQVPSYICWERPPAPQAWGPETYMVPDGAILYAYPGLLDEIDFVISFWIPFSAGQFLAARGEAARLAYADRGSWTGEPLPLPTECPVVDGLQLCGGRCGGCPDGEGCTGRSPLHPWGLCIPEREIGDQHAVCSARKGSTGCEWGSSCFVFTVDAAHQAIADSKGLCLPRALCDAAAAGLPGGGRCVE